MYLLKAVVHTDTYWIAENCDEMPRRIVLFILQYAAQHFIAVFLTWGPQAIMSINNNIRDLAEWQAERSPVKFSTIQYVCTNSKA